MRILTVDVEDWFHILDNSATMSEGDWKDFPSRVERETVRLLDLFDRHHKTATFFILGYIARKHPAVIQEIARRGHEIATHGDMHQLVYCQTPAEFEADLVKSMESIDEACGQIPLAYRAPGFSIKENSTWAFDILARNGIDIDSSIFPSNRSHGGMSNFSESGPCRLVTKTGATIREFPINVLKIGTGSLVFSGGGYFRLIPRPLLNQLFKKEGYLMTYFHPRDFDSSQPKVPGLNLKRHFKSYVGLKRAYHKLDQLLGSYDFISLGEGNRRIKWESVPLIQL